MSPPPRRSHGEQPSRAVRLLETAALACILAVMVARPFINEMPFRYPHLAFAKGLSKQAQKPSDELSRVTFAMILLGAVCLWATAQTLRRRLRIAAAGFGLMILIFAALSLSSALGAPDRRSGLDGWLEQLSNLLAAFAVVQLARDRRRRGLIIVVVAALGITMAWKSLDETFSAIPERVRTFEENRANILRMEGVDPGSPKARMMEKRIRDPSATGYLGLANVFGSLLVVLAAGAAGLAIDKLVAARRDRKAGPPLKRGQIHLPTLAAGIGIVLGALPLVGLVLTRSKGGIAAGALACTAGGILLLRPSFFARHRRKLLTACAVAAAAGILAVAAYGTRRGSLPTRSMQVRWEYWVGASRLVREHPLRGIGPGNFGDAYLKHRLPAAAESTKSAHNVLLDASCAYGLPGAGLYLALLVWVVLAISRPAAPEATAAGPRGGSRAMIVWCILLAAGVLVVRAGWETTTQASGFFMIVIFPALVFAVAFLAAAWSGRGLGAADVCGRFGRIVLGAGLVGFILHNLITFTLWSPATATVFWVAAGAAIAPAARQRQWSWSAGRGAIPRAIAFAAAVVISAAVMVLCYALLWLPVRERTSYLRSAQSAYALGQARSAITNLRAAVDADEMDGIAPGYLASMYVAFQPARQKFADSAVYFAELGWKRAPNSLQALLLARSLWKQGRDPQRALATAEMALELDPMNVRLRWEYGDMLVQSGRFDAAREQLRRTRRIDAARPADSDLRLTPKELEAIGLLEKKIDQAGP